MSKEKLDFYQSRIDQMTNTWTEKLDQLIDQLKEAIKTAPVQESVRQQWLQYLENKELNKLTHEVTTEFDKAHRNFQDLMDEIESEFNIL